MTAADVARWEEVEPRIRGWVRRFASPATIQWWGLEDLEQRSRLRVLRAAGRYDQSSGVRWDQYARHSVRSLVRYDDVSRRRWVWAWGQVGDPDAAPARRPQSLWSVWDDLAPLRADLPLRHRVILYLVAVEGWAAREVATTLGTGEAHVSRVLAGCREWIRLGLQGG